MKFFEEFNVIYKEFLEKKRKEDEVLGKFFFEFEDLKENIIKKFIDDEEYWKEMLKVFGSFFLNLILGFVLFLNCCIDEIWIRVELKNVFDVYN